MIQDSTLHPAPFTQTATKRILASVGRKIFTLSFAIFALIPAALIYLALEFLWVSLRPMHVSSRRRTDTP